MVGTTGAGMGALVGDGTIGDGTDGITGDGTVGVITTHFGVLLTMAAIMVGPTIVLIDMVITVILMDIMDTIALTDPVITPTIVIIDPGFRTVQPDVAVTLPADELQIHLLASQIQNTTPQGVAV